VIIGDVDDLVVDEFQIDRVNWHAVVGIGDPGRAQSAGVRDPGCNDEINVVVKIRYSHPGTAATLTLLENGRAHIRLHQPQRAVTPGQAAVFYDGDVVLGGGWICRTEPVRRTGALSRLAAPMLA
jgi:tRNA-specific 2-thiouridylase